MSLSDIEKEILAEGERIYAAAKKAALELRKDGLLAEIKTIEQELAKLLGHDTPAEPDPEPAPQPEPAPAPPVDPEPAPAPEADAPAEPKADQKDAKAKS